jgi:methyl-accepting chemotaxis protein
LNQVVQQNAAASEEMATNAEELATQAERLKEMARFFKVNMNPIEDRFSGTRKSQEYRTQSKLNIAHMTKTAPVYNQKQNKNMESKGIDLKMQANDHFDNDFNTY